MSDIFEEVEEEVRKDRMSEIWSKYGWIVWVLAIGIVLAVAANEVLSYQRGQAQQDRSIRLEAAIDALDTGDYSAAEERLASLVDEDVALSAMVAHLQAQLRLDASGDLDGAGMALAGIADAEEGAFEQLALLKSIYLRSESLTLVEVENELAPLVSKETPIGALAQEIIAAKAFEEGDYERARRDFNRLRFAANAPSGLVQRATIALDAIPRIPADDSAPLPDDGDELPETEDTP